MTIASNKTVEAADVNNLSKTFADNLVAYEIRRQALLVDSVWRNYTPSDVKPVVYNGSFIFNKPTVASYQVIDDDVLQKFGAASTQFQNRLKQTVDGDKVITTDNIIHSGEVKNTYENTTIEAQHFNVFLTILTRALNILQQYDWYDSYVVGVGKCKRSCQVKCQTTCQAICQGYHSCHNQKCGAH